jgi:CheY-like chemotaxis protein
MARVLMVDDDEMERVYAAEVLRWGGHEPVFAPDGATALKIFERGDIDVVVTDLAMPKLNGLALIREVLKLDPDARVVAISGATPEQLDEAKRLGAAYTFAKPWDPRELVQAIDRAFARPKRSSGQIIDDKSWY